MDLGQLLLFAPLLIAGAWLSYLIFRKDLASETLGKIISYFVGIIIILFAVKFFVTDMIIPWTNDILQQSQTNQELIEFITSSEDIVVSSFDGDDSTDVVEAANQLLESSVTAVEATQPEVDEAPVALPQPTEIPAPAIEATAMPITQDLLAPQSGTITYTVVSGDTLFSIGEQYGVVFEDIVSTNNLNTMTIIPGQTLLIPQSNGQVSSDR